MLSLFQRLVEICVINECKILKTQDAMPIKRNSIIYFDSFSFMLHLERICLKYFQGIRCKRVKKLKMLLRIAYGFCKTLI